MNHHRTSQGRRTSRVVIAALLPFAAVALLWSVYFVDTGLGLDLRRFGIVPRDMEGLVGVFTAPFLHAGFEHLFNNSVPLFVLGWMLVYVYPRAAARVVLAVWLLGGLWVWISARSSLHIGASGVVYGLASFLFFSGLIRKQRTLMGVSLLVTFLYGGMIWGLFPLVERISWESHLWGALAGLAMAGVFRNVEPAISDPVPRYLQEAEEDEEEVAAPVPPAPPRTTRRMVVVYHFDPGDEADEEELRWKRDLQGRTGTLPEHLTDGTWE